MLVPTRIYGRAFAVLRDLPGVHAAAHITGGGLIENPPRVLPPGLGVDIDPSKIPLPAIMGDIMAQGVSRPEMLRTFNCGIGMMVVVAADEAEAVGAALAGVDEPCVDIGHVTKLAEGEPAVLLRD